MSDGMNPFVLLARITVKEGKLEEYLAIASEVDKAVESTEQEQNLLISDRKCAKLLMK